MIFKVVKVIENDMNDDEFIAMCKSSFRKAVIICTFFIALCAILMLCVLSMEQSPKILRFLASISLFTGVISFLVLFGTPYEFWNGMIIQYLECKSVKDWAIFAERQFGQKGAIITKRLELEEKEVFEVCLDSKELRCRNGKTGKMEIFSLDKTFKDEFIFKEKMELADGEIILDFRGKNLIAFLNHKELMRFGKTPSESSGLDDIFLSLFVEETKKGEKNDH